MTVAAERTDWDRYYSRPFPATSVTRRITGATLLRLITRYAPAGGRARPLIELGGANSCFFDAIQRRIAPSEYHVVDFNRFGLDRMAQRLGPRPDVHYYQRDVLDLDLPVRAPLVFSIGLIEHFSPADTARAIDAHFRLLEPRGIAITSFPTPTPPYRACRALAERLGLWSFPDERPLRLPEVRAAVERHGELLHHEIVWPIILTQMFIVARKR